jgi:hypothetical protein
MTHLLKTIVENREPIYSNIPAQEVYEGITTGPSEENSDYVKALWNQGYNSTLSEPNTKKIMKSIESAFSDYKKYMGRYDSNPKFYLESYESGDKPFLKTKTPYQLAVNFEVGNPQDLQNFLSAKDLILVSSKIEKKI